MNGLIQFIRFIIDRGSIAQATKEAEQAGADIGKAAGRGAQQFLPETRKLFSGIVGSMRGKIDDLGIGAVRVFDTIKTAGAEAFTKAFPFTLALLMEHAIRQVWEATKDLTMELIHAAAEGQRVFIEFDTVFGELTDHMEEVVGELGQLFGTSNREMRELLLHVQGVNLGLGMSREVASDTSEAMVRLAGDIAAFRGVPFERALNAVQTGMMGITRNAHQLGIPLTQRIIQMQAMADTGKKNASELTEQEKALGAFHAMLSRTAEMTGAAQRNSANLGVAWGRITAIFKNVRDEVAIEMIPVLQSLGEWIMMNKDEIVFWVKGGFELLANTLNVTINLFRALYDVVDASMFGISSTIEITLGNIVEGFGHLIRSQKTMAAGLKLQAAGWGDATKAGERYQDFLKAMTSALGPSTLPRHPAGAMPGAMPGEGVDPEAGKKARKLLEDQYRMVKEGLQLDETRAAAKDLQVVVEGKIYAILSNQNTTLEDRIKYLKMAHDLELMNVTQYDKELATATALSKEEGHRNEGLDQLIGLAWRYANLTTSSQEEEQARLDRLHKTYAAIADVRGQDVEDELKQAGQVDNMTAHVYLLLDAAKKIAALRKTAETKEDIEAVDKLGHDMKRMLDQFSLAQEIVGVFDSAAHGAQSFSDALHMLQNDAQLTHKILMVMFTGTAKSAARELADLAKLKMLENLAWAAEDIGLQLLGHPGAGAGAASHLKSAALWGALAGAAGAAAGGNGGGEAGATPGGEGGRIAGQSSGPQPLTIIYLDQFNKDNPVHQAIVGDTIQQGLETGNIKVYPTSAAPPSITRTARGTR